MAAEPTTTCTLHLPTLLRMLNRVEVKVGHAKLLWELTQEEDPTDRCVRVLDLLYHDGWGVSTQNGRQFMHCLAHKAISYMRSYTDGVVDPGDAITRLLERKHSQLLQPIPGYTSRASLALALQRIQDIAEIATAQGGQKF